MNQAAPNVTAGAIAVAKVLDHVMRSDRGRLLSALVAGLRNLSLAEEALQEAAVSAMAHWARSGIPNSPQGWLLTVARRKALDRLRGSARENKKAKDLSLFIEEEVQDAEDIPDERLRLIFACCHPALEMKSRVALTLRTVCGLTTTDIARMFLDQEPTMGQRLSRAKTKIASAGIRFEVPEPEHWPTRLDAVLTTVYLIFTTGYVGGPDEARDLCQEAEYLMRLINRLRPDNAEIEGALAMILLTAARRAARIGTDGASLPPAEQDRNLWDQAKIIEGRAMLNSAMARRDPGPFQIKAAIADCQMANPAPDWPQIALLYQSLLRYEPTPVVVLNAAVAAAEAGEPARALGVVDGLANELSDYQPWHAARAALLAMNGKRSEAATAYTHAIDHAPGRAEALFLQKRLADLNAEA
jgi:RNA polymerase sigma factor (sigma-70 family)